MYTYKTVSIFKVLGRVIKSHQPYHLNVPTTRMRTTSCATTRMRTTTILREIVKLDERVHGIYVPKLFSEANSEQLNFLRRFGRELAWFPGTKRRTKCLVSAVCTCQKMPQNLILNKFSISACCPIPFINCNGLSVRCMQSVNERC